MINFMIRMSDANNKMSAETLSILSRHSTTTIWSKTTQMTKLTTTNLISYILMKKYGNSMWRVWKACMSFMRSGTWERGWINTVRLWLRLKRLLFKNFCNHDLDFLNLNDWATWHFVWFLEFPDLNIDIFGLCTYINLEYYVEIDIHKNK